MIDPLLKSEKEQYDHAVEKFTSESWENYQNEINPENLVRDNDVHVDHIFSRHERFIQE